MTVAERKVARALERLDNDTPFFCRNAVRIVTKQGELVALDPNPAQLKIEAAMREQEAAGKPIRVILLKARQTGGSTYVQAKVEQRISRRQNRRARVVAHDDETAQNLFGMGTTMYSHLPPEIKPPLEHGQRGRSRAYGERQRYSSATGPGYGSSIRVDTAADITGGRGLTIHYLHLSEFAFWKDPRTKLLALMSAVPNVPDTIVVIESTANGFNDFRDEWVRAEKGESDFIPVFVGWQDEPEYARPFASPQERERFAAGVGEGEVGKDEPALLEAGCTLEQLNWRRWAVANLAGGSLDQFKQEYPSNSEEAFLATGQRIFDPNHVLRIVRGCKKAAEGGIQTTKDRTFVSKGHALVIPGEPSFKRGKGTWRVWRLPEKPEERFIVAVDVSGAMDTPEGAWHAIQVIDHRTREQVARYRSKVDEDVLAREAYKAAKLYNDAWLAVETTGGWGLPVARICRRDYHYPFMYQRKKLDRANFDSSQDRLGWDTNNVTRPQIIANGTQLVRDGLDGLVDEDTAREMLTWVRNDRGKPVPERGAFDDLLMCWLIGQFIANELPPRRDRKSSSTGAQSYHTPRNPITGY